MTCRILTNYDGANASRFNIQQLAGRIIIEYPPETCRALGVSHDYAWSFNFGLESVSDTKSVIQVLINCAEFDGWEGKPFALYTASDPAEGFSLESMTGKSDGYTRYVFDVPLEPGERIYVSNTIPRHYSTLVPSLMSYGDLSGIQRIEYGHSVEGRSLFALELGEQSNGRPTVLVTTGMHPPEGDSFAAESILEHLVGRGREWLDHFNVVIVPLVNPDGFVHGRNGTNVNDINLYWEFQHERKTQAPEAYYLWNYMLRVRPSLYLDFHAYVTQSHKDMQPYLKPIRLYHADEVRQVVESMDNFLLEYCDGRAVRGYSTYGKTTLAHLITRELNTITYTKFHFHLSEGVPAVQRHAVALFDGLCDILRNKGITKGHQVVRARGLSSRLILSGLTLGGEIKGYLRTIRDWLKG
mgnify:CR=1 FL=1